jgi:hypothetical protein
MRHVERLVTSWDFDTCYRYMWSQDLAYQVDETYTIEMVQKCCVEIIVERVLYRAYDRRERRLGGAQ